MSFSIRNFISKKEHRVYSNTTEYCHVFIVLNGSLTIRLKFFDTEVKIMQKRNGKRLEIDMC